MTNNNIHWFEAKQLDRVTNFSSRIEIVKRGIERNSNINYYCTFALKKNTYNLNNIFYLGCAKNKIIKKLEFNLLVMLKSILLILKKSNNTIIVNQDLIKNVLPARFLNKWLRKKNKFVVDIRTTPTNPSTFDLDMKKFHSKFKYAVKYFDGLSFITPFMESYVMSFYSKKLPSVNWSSGVDVKLFDYSKVKHNKLKDRRFTIFYHGGISESRGNLNLIKACEHLINKGYDIKLQQVGIVVDKSIADYISKNKLNHWCELLPPEDLKNMPQYIANCDLPVLPFPNFMAWRVSSPIKLMEYLAMGKKVLAPKMEAFTDVFGDDEHQVFYFNSDKDDVKNMADRIKQIIDGEQLKRYNPNDLVSFVKEEFTWKHQANKLLDFCESL